MDEESRDLAEEEWESYANPVHFDIGESIGEESDPNNSRWGMPFDPDTKSAPQRSEASQAHS
jgi:hypothetical protein